MPDALPLSLILLLAAAVVLYVGTRLLWASAPWPGLWRGVVMSGPVIVLALIHAPATPATAIAMLVSAAVLALTLGLGVSTVDLPVDEADGTPMLRTLPLLAATVCLAGFHGYLGWSHAAAIAVVGGLTLWTAAGERRTPPTPATAPYLLPAVLCVAGGLALLLVASRLFVHASASAALTPVVVLLTVPAVLLALLGLLSAEPREHRPDTPQETVTGLAVACLGIGLPLVIGVARLTPIVGRHWSALASYASVPAFVATTQPAMTATTFPTTAAAAPVLVWPAVVMPLVTWRVDSVLLVVVTILLLPIGTGRFKLGRAEGAWLILIYLAYAAVATRTGAMTG